MAGLGRLQSTRITKTPLDPITIYQLTAQCEYFCAGLLEMQTVCTCLCAVAATEGCQYVHVPAALLRKHIAGAFFLLPFLVTLTLLCRLKSTSAGSLVCCVSKGRSNEVYAGVRKMSCSGLAYKDCHGGSSTAVPALSQMI